MEENLIVDAQVSVTDYGHRPALSIEIIDKDGERFRNYISAFKGSRTVDFIAGLRRLADQLEGRIK